MTKTWSIVLATAIVLAAGSVRAWAQAASPSEAQLQRALSDLRSGDWILQWQAMELLGQWKTLQAAVPIRELLTRETDRPFLRGEAIKALARIEGRALADQVLRHADDRAWEVRAAAVEALGLLGSGQKVVEAKLKDPVPAVRYRAIVALAMLDKAQAERTVVYYLKDKDPAMVRSATASLVHVATREATSKLVEQLSHADKDVRLAAAEAIARVRPVQAIAPLVARMAGDEDAGVRQAAQRTLQAYEPSQRVDPLLAVLKGGDAKLYPPAIRILADNPTPEIAREISWMLRLKRQQYEGVLADAMDLLARSNAGEYAAIFEQALGSPEAVVRRKAVECLALCDKCDRWGLLRPLLADADSNVRKAAYQTLRDKTQGEPPGGIAGYLAPALASGDAWTYRAAIAFLGERISPPNAVSAVKALDRFFAMEDGNMRRLAAEALAGAADEEASRLAAARQGFLVDWAVIGSFAGLADANALDRIYPPDRNADPKIRMSAWPLEEGGGMELGNADFVKPAKPGVLRMTPATAGGKFIADWTLRLPGESKLTLALTCAHGPRDKGDGVVLGVRVEGQELAQQTFDQPGQWQSVQVDLSPYAGRQVTISLVVDSRESSREDLLAVSEAVIRGREDVADLIKLAATAAVRTESSGAGDRQIGWEAVRCKRVDGVIHLHDVLAVPIEHRLAYAQAEVLSDTEREVVLSYAVDDAARIWVNGQELSDIRKARSGKATITLRRGLNRVMLKVANYSEYWTYRIRLSDGQDRRIEELAGR